MTTVDAAREALLAYDERTDSLILLVDAFEAAIRAESAETLRALTDLLDRWEADGHGDLVSATAIRAALAATPEYDTRLVEYVGPQWPDVIVEKWERNQIGDRRFVESVALTRREPLDVDTLWKAMRRVGHADGNHSGSKKTARLYAGRLTAERIAAEYARLEAERDAP